MARFIFIILSIDLVYIKLIVNSIFELNSEFQKYTVCQQLIRKTSLDNSAPKMEFNSLKHEIFHVPALWVEVKYFAFTGTFASF